MKQTRFFCENCGAEVGRDAKQCPACGKFFSSILCPSCGFSGEEFLFDQGCPVCGYSAPGGKPVNAPANTNGRHPRKSKPSGALPWWVYALTVLALLGVLAAFVLFK
ncbi:MAG: zinc ribbon domain-containing protein [Spirochaetaceae bacterium]|jgi:uncharacterized membrane protein YvbJ|nr:zinc ribbon domain-containing protein [Spirochaetaceae bacterium]